jgi:Lon protease-like protein
MSENRFSLFPLSAHLLPEGRMALRIFEPRYVRMVKEACAADKGFVMCMLNAKGDKDKNEHILKYGTFAKVIDFDILDDGLLGIKVAGINIVEVSSIETERDGLRTGLCKDVTPNRCDISPKQIMPMDERLKEIFDRYGELKSLYEAPKFDDPQWVLNRWLELLPVDGEQKQRFIANNDSKMLLNYLSALIP